MQLLFVIYQPLYKVGYKALQPFIGDVAVFIADIGGKLGITACYDIVDLFQLIRKFLLSEIHKICGFLVQFHCFRSFSVKSAGSY